MSISYEWDAETVTTVESADYEDGEVLEHYHTETLADALRHAKQTQLEPGQGFRIVLVRDRFSNHDLECRSWAYLNDDGTVPDCFEDAYGRNTADVPVRFHREAAAARGQA